jgi:hypothetical protein
MQLVGECLLGLLQERKQINTHNYAINADRKKRRSFVAPHFPAGYGERLGSQDSNRDSRRPNIDERMES